MPKHTHSQQSRRPLASEAAIRAASQKLQFPTPNTTHLANAELEKAEAEPDYNPLLDRLMESSAVGTGLDKLNFWHAKLKY